MARRSSLLVILLVAFLCLMLPESSTGTGSGPAFVDGEVLLKLLPGAPASERVRLQGELGAETVHAFLSGAEHWRLAQGVSVQEALARLSASPLVVYAEPNYILSADVIPDDPRLSELWGMVNTGQTGGTADADVDADLAWGVSTGSPDVVVGIIDTGIDYNHPDLALNIWTNPGEIPGNGIDDDANGYVDDIRGYDFINNDGDPFDDNGHGTHVSGTITARGNNAVGVAGVAWNVKLMGLKFLSASGSGSTDNAVRAVDYATMMGVDLTSNSWGGGGFSQTLYDAIARAGAQEIAFVAAAGNDNVNNDTSPHYPSNYDLPNIISVAATDHNDAKSSFSNWGPTSVDLAAPGTNILSTMPGNTYGSLSGTSMATPHVSGACALIRSISPNIPVAQMKSVLLNSVDHIASMQGLVVSSGRLNAFFAIAEPDDVPPGAVVNLAASDPGSNTMGLTWTAPGDDGLTGTATYYEVRYSLSPIDEGNFAAAERAGNEPVPAVAGTIQQMEVRGLDANKLYYFAMKAFDEWGNVGPLSNVVEASTLPPPTAVADPLTIADALFTGEQSDHVVTLTNTGVGTLDFTIPSPSVGEPQAVAEPLKLGKDEIDPRHGEPVVANAGGPDTFGYRWMDSDEPGGPVFAWTDIAATGTPINITADDATSGPLALGFNVAFYGTFFDSIRVCTNGWLSFTSSASSYSNQPLPSTGAPENLIAPFWDDLNPAGTQKIFFESFGNKAIVQWNAIAPYSGTGTFTFQAIIDQSGAVTFQYLAMTGAVNSATVGIQDASKTVGLQVAFNQAYIHDELAVRIAATPQWLTASPSSGRLHAGESIPINVHMDASGLEGGTYPGTVNILTNDPAQPNIPVQVTLQVTGAPDIAVQPASIDYGDRFVNNPHTASLIVANDGTDVLHVTEIVGSAPELTATPNVFDVPPRGSQNVTVTWAPTLIGPFSGSLTVQSNDAADPSLAVPVTGNAVAAPIMIVDPALFDETLYSGHQVVRQLNVTNTGGSTLEVTAAADQGVSGNGTGLVYAPDESAEGAGGPDAFGYRWKDSDESGGPAYDFVDISGTGTTITFTSQDDALSAAISMGMTFPFYGSNFSSLKVGTNGFLTFDTTDTSTRLSNYSLPSTSGAKNQIAIFWDDLHLRTGNVKYLNDGTRFIIQYTNVEKYSPSGSPLTFQVQLYPSGKILLQYRTMAGTLNSATIGIQDGTKTIGLTANYNANYVHSGLAVQFSRVPDWLTVTPNHASVPPGASFAFDVKFDSTSRNGGDLTGAVVLTTNIPSQATERVPATLHVIGAPIVGLVPTSYAYGTRYTGYSYLTTFQVVNNGTDVLNVSSVYSSDPTLLVEDPQGGEAIPEAEFPLLPGQARLFNLRWAPMLPAPLDAQVHVLSSDPVTPDAILPVTGNAILPPVAVWAPDHFAESMNSGELVHRTLNLANQGGSDLTFAVAVQLDSGAVVTVDSSPELKKDEADTRPGILGSGGPDVFGYRWKDSDAPGGPAFGWVDISSIGTPIPLNADDQNLGTFPIGFDFPFYGQTFNTFRACTNGFLSFTSTATSLTNYQLPSTSAPENLLAVFHDDQDFRTAGAAYYYNDGSRLIVSYVAVPRYSSGGPYTYQVILYPSGKIVYQYLDMQGTRLNEATVGIQNADKNDGLTVVYNAAYVHDSLAVEFSPPANWLRVSPTSGTVGAGLATDLDVTIDSTGLLGGNYAATIDLVTNDPVHAAISVPVSLHVIGTPDIDAQPTSLLFPTTFVGFSSQQVLNVRNVGSDTVHITGLTVEGEFQAAGLAPPVDLGPGGSIPVTVSFLPLDEGTRLGALTLVSDDPDEPALIVPLQGEGLWPPEMHATPPEIHAALPPGGQGTKVLNIANAGGSDLVWDGGTNLISIAVGVTPGTYVELEKGEEDTREGALGTGGPDLYGYRWVDSNEAGGPAYDWFDISAIGTQLTGLTGDDQTALSVPLGISFPFYGNSFTTASVCTNGWLSFTSSLTAYTNQPLPNTGTAVPENLIAAFWDDLHMRTTGKVFTWSDGSRFIVQWNNVERLTAGSLFTFQIQLFPNGRVLLQYKSMSGLLNSGTIGIQDAGKSDGLTVVFNQDYVHSEMAIEFKNIPQWLHIAPEEGTVAEGGNQDVSVLLDVAGLEDGMHEGTIQLRSNDPYNPLVEVPVFVNVGVIEPTLTEFVPKVLRFADTGILRVRMTVELPAGLNPHDIRLSSVVMNDVVPALADPAPYYTDDNHNGIEEATFWFDWNLVKTTLAEGMLIPVTIMGEVEDVQWFRGTDYIRTGDPDQYAPVPGAYFTAGQPVPIRWNESSSEIAHRYTIQLSRDGGSTWETLATQLTATSFDWTAAGPATTNAIVRVLSYDVTGRLLGSDDSAAPFTIAGGILAPPLPIDGAQLLVERLGAETVLTWKPPVADLDHGPADRYHVYRGTDPQNLVEVALVNTTEYREQAGAPVPGLVYYRIVAANTSGDAR